jgi:aryl-phospho-beta-D-glucosidase BglC (GH1 family)
MKFKPGFKLWIAISILATVGICLIVGNKPGVRAAGGLSVQYKCGKTDTLAQSVRPWTIIYNNSGASVNLADIKMRYYYSKEGVTSESLQTFWVGVGATNVTATFHPEKGYTEIGFTSAAGSIPDGGNSQEIQIAFNKPTNGYYNQADDYSFDPSFTSYAEYNKITLYQNGVLVWGNEGPLPTPTPVPPPSGDDWLHTDGNTIKDAGGNVVRLTGINWFGFETGGANGFYGLDKCGVEETLDLLASRGFNLLRIPVNGEIIKEWSNGTYVNTSFMNTYYNPYLDGMNSLQILDYTVNYCKRTGMKIMFDMHGASRDSYQENLWYNSKISQADFITSWKWLANRYKGDDTVVAMDLKNEPHGKYSGSTISKWDGTSDANNWKKAAEDIGNAVLSVNPNLLIVIEGVEAYPMEGYDYNTCGEFTTYCNWWGSNLRGVAKYPVSLSTANRVVYSAHDYGPDIYVQPWFKTTFNETTLYNDCWRPNWYYIVEAGTAPVLIGEWGGKLANANNKAWFTALASFLSTKNIHHTFWSFNPNSADTGGLVLDDWRTVDETKYAIIKTTLWMKGLDHAVPLGAAPKITPGPTPVRTPTPVAVVTATPAPVNTPTPRVTATLTPVITATPVLTPTPVRTGTPRRTATPRRTPTAARTATPRVAVTPTPVLVTPTPPPGTGSIKVQFYNQNTAATTNQLYLNFKLINTGSSSIALSNVKIRYFYTKDGTQAQNFYCDYAQAGSSNVTGSIAAMSTPKTGADTYVEIGFASSAGSLAASGGNTTVQSRVAKSDWSNYTQTNDYSFNSTATGFVDWTQVTGYISGVLQWGTEP